MRDRCGVCRARLVRGDRSCPSCGAAANDVVDLEGASSPGSETTHIVDTSTRRGRAVAIAITVITVIVAATVAREVTSDSDTPNAASVPTTTDAAPALRRPLPSFYANLDPLDDPVSIAVVSDGQLHIVTTDGDDILIGAGYEPSWSPSRQWLAFRRGDGEIWIVRRDGANPYRVAGTGAFGWSPVTDGLAVASVGGVFVEYPTGRAAKVDIRDANDVVWSEDGSRLGYTVTGPGGENLTTADRDGDGPRDIYDATGADLRLARWTAAGILGWVHEWPLSTDDAANGLPLIAINPDIGSAREVGTTLPFRDWIVQRPTRPPVIALVSGEGGEGRDATVNKLLEVCDPGFVGCAAVSDSEPLRDPAWSPNGQALAATSSRGLAIDTDEGLTIIAGSRGAANPVWLRDSRHIVALSDQALWLYDTQQFAAPVFLAGPVSIDDRDGDANVSFDGHIDLSQLVAVG